VSNAWVINREKKSFWGLTTSLSITSRNGCTWSMLLLVLKLFYCQFKTDFFNVQIINISSSTEQISSSAAPHACWFKYVHTRLSMIFFSLRQFSWYNGCQYGDWRLKNSKLFFFSFRSVKERRGRVDERLNVSSLVALIHFPKLISHYWK